MGSVGLSTACTVGREPDQSRAHQPCLSPHHPMSCLPGQDSVRHKWSRSPLGPQDPHLGTRAQKGVNVRLGWRGRAGPGAASGVGPLGRNPTHKGCCPGSSPTCQALCRAALQPGEVCPPPGQGPWEALVCPDHTQTWWLQQGCTNPYSVPRCNYNPAPAL